MEALTYITKAFTSIKGSLTPKQRLLIQLFITIFTENRNEELTENELKLVFLIKTKEPSIHRIVTTRGIGYYIQVVNGLLSKNKIIYRISRSTNENSDEIRKFKFQSKEKSKE